MKNRRQMAWATLVAALMFPLLILFTESDQLGAIATQFYAFSTLILMAYFGIATADHVMMKDKDEPSKES